MKKSTKILLFISALFLSISIFVPIWRIELDAPQYPEGLNLLIYADKLGGNVEIINGLNHYIGMRTLHANDFIEFTVLPYIIGFFALLNLLVLFSANKKFLNVLFILFVAFGVLAMVDFWRWEYDYGHNLDPNAAIVVPGMAYQPPLIGFKQLLNFGAFSIPDIGGILFIASGLILLVAVYSEKSFRFRKKNITTSLFLILGMSAFASCSNFEPEKIKYNYDQCESCKMSISDTRFACELITQKGRAYKFDDLSCMSSYVMANTTIKIEKYFINDYLNSQELVPIESLSFLKAESLNSPMAGNIAAFASKDSADKYATELNAERINWESVINQK